MKFFKRKNNIKKEIHISQIPISDLTYDKCLKAVMKNPSDIKYVPTNLRDEEMIEMVIKREPTLVIYSYHLENQDTIKRLCKYAVSKLSYLIEYVPEYIIDEELSLIAVNQCGLNLMYIHNQNNKICLAAVRNNGSSLLYVNKQTEEICLEAVSQDGIALQYVENQTPEICLAAVKNNTTALQFVKDQTIDLCIIALKISGEAIRYIRNQTEELCIMAVEDEPMMLRYVVNKTPAICSVAVDIYPMTLQFVPKGLQTIPMCINAVRRSPESLRFIKIQSKKVYKTALSQNGKAIIYVPYEYRDEMSKYMNIHPDPRCINHIAEKNRTDEMYKFVLSSGMDSAIGYLEADRMLDILNEIEIEEIDVDEQY